MNSASEVEPVGEELRSRGTSMRVSWLALVAAVLGYLWFVGQNCAPYASNSDASGYLNSTRLMAEGRLTMTVPDIEGFAAGEWNSVFQQPLGFRQIGNGAVMAPTYPVGYPLHLLLAVPVVGTDWTAVPVNLAAVTAVGWLMFALGRRIGLGAGWSLAGVALIWASPCFLYHALQPMSDVLATAWCMAAVYFAFRAHARAAWAIAAGFAYATAVLVRPTNALLLPALIAIIGLRWPLWWRIALGGVPGALFLAWYNLQLYGAVATTGYGDVSWALGSKYLAHGLQHFAVQLPLLLSPLVALAALAAPTLYRRQRSTLLVLAAWLVPFTAFYAMYFFAGTDWRALRFLMPTFPAILLAALLVARDWSGRISSPPVRYGLLVTLLGLALAWEVIAANRLYAFVMKRAEVVYVQTVDWMKAHVPSDAIVLTSQASGAFCYYSQFTIVRFDLAGPNHLERLYEVAARTSRPVYAAIFMGEKNAPAVLQLPGTWTVVQNLGAFEVWKLDAR